MCGIYGIVSAGRNPIPQSWRDRLRFVLNHRGPDQHGCFDAPGVIMGVNRLAILDVAGGAQPVYNEDRSLVIVYNGEIYNHQVLRRELTAQGHNFRSNSDTETILHAFEEFGDDVVRRLNGMFAFAIWNLRTGILFLARDRLGIKPLYVTEIEDKHWAFASEAKGLLNIVAGHVRVDWQTISHYFSFGYCPCPLSPYQGIRKFPAGHFGWLKEQTLQMTPYWAPSYGGAGDVSVNDARTRVLVLLEEVVQKELMSDVPVGVFLSGGLDSSAVALFAAKHSRNRVSSFALRFQESSHDESEDARAVADYLKMDHHECFFDKRQLRKSLHDVAAMLDEPFADSTVLPLFYLSTFARQSVKVVLTGWGGDELFAGYPTYRAHHLASAYRRLPNWLANKWIPAIVRSLPVSDRYMSFEFKARRFIQGMNLPPELQHFVWMGYFNDAAKKIMFRKHIRDQITSSSLDLVIDAVGKLTEPEMIDRIMHLDAIFFLENNGLFQADRMTMAASLEARVPLLNNDLVDYVSALPASLKMQKGAVKELMRNALRKRLPGRIISKPKKGFGPPASVWVREGLRDVIARVLSRERIEDQNIFMYDEINCLLTEHWNRQADHGRIIWALFGFQLWYETFIIGKNPLADIDGLQ